MRAGLWQLAHTPVCAQGVLQARRCAFAGAASVSSRCCASARSFTSLLQPATSATLRGPKASAAMRLARPSTLKISPSSVMALALHKNQSAEKWARSTASFSASVRPGAALSRNLTLPLCKNCSTPHSASVTEPPMPTDEPGAIQCSSRGSTSAALSTHTASMLFFRSAWAVRSMRWRMTFLAASCISNRLHFNNLLLSARPGRLPGRPCLYHIINHPFWNREIDGRRIKSSAPLQPG